VPDPRRKSIVVIINDLLSLSNMKEFLLILLVEDAVLIVLILLDDLGDNLVFPDAIAEFVGEILQEILT